MSMERGTGGNRFIEADASIADLVDAVQVGLVSLWHYATPDRYLDLAEVTITTTRIPSGRISVEVSADLKSSPASAGPGGHVPGAGEHVDHPGAPSPAPGGSTSGGAA